MHEHGVSAFLYAMNDRKKNYDRKWQGQSRRIRTGVWGVGIVNGQFGKWTTEDAKRAYAVGKRFEEWAGKTVLPAEGFSEIECLSDIQRGSPVDFVATKNGKRVLVDVTIRQGTGIEHKVKMAKALRMDLYIIHVSPVHQNRYWVDEIKSYERVYSKVPNQIIRDLALKN